MKPFTRPYQAPSYQLILVSEANGAERYGPKFTSKAKAASECGRLNKDVAPTTQWRVV